MAHAKGHNIQCFGGNATKVNVYQELLVSDFHTLEDYSEKTQHVLVSCALDMIIFFFFIPISLCFSKDKFLKGFSVFRAVQFPHAEDKSCLLPQFPVDTNVTDG